MKKVVASVGIGLLFVIVITINIAILWFIYTHFFVSKNDQSQEMQQQKSLIDTLTGIKTNAEQGQLQNDYVVTVQDEAKIASNAFVYLGLTTPKQPLGVQPEAYLRISRSTNQPFDATSLTSVEERITDTLTQQGFSVSELTLPSDTLHSYESPSVICSLYGVLGSPTVALACTDTETARIAKENAQKIASERLTSSSSIKYLQYLFKAGESDSDAIAILEAFQADNFKSHSYVYTYNEGSWIYVDDALSAKPGESGGGKITATQKIQTFIEDPVYGPLYLSLLGSDN